MTPQHILTRSIDWLAIMRKAGVRFSPRTMKALNSLTEYLGTCAELEQDETDCPHDEAAKLLDAGRMT